jgi:hypothetical protein
MRSRQSMTPLRSLIFGPVRLDTHPLQKTKGILAKENKRSSSLSPLNALDELAMKVLRHTMELVFAAAFIPRSLTRVHRRLLG